MITEYREYGTPSKVYLPLTDLKYKIANVHVRVGDKVLAGQIVADKFKGKSKRSIISSVSGTVVSFEEKIDRYGKYVDHIVIENNSKNEVVEVAKFADEVTPAQVRNRLIEFGIDTVSYDGLYTDVDFADPIKHVVVNAIYSNEPFVSTDYEFLSDNAEAIADGIQLLGTAAYAETMTVIVDKFMPGAALDALGKAIVDKNIELVSKDTRKAKGWDYKVISKVAGKKVTLAVGFSHPVEIMLEEGISAEAPSNTELIFISRCNCLNLLRVSSNSSELSNKPI